MKILLIAPQPFLTKRGTPLAVYQLLKAFSELGHSVDVATFHIGEDVEIDNVRLYRTPALPFVTAVKKGASGAKLLLDLFLFVRAASLLRHNRYDVIHGVEEGAIIGVVLGYFFRLPVVMDMDSSIPDQLCDSRSPLWSSEVIVRVASALERWTVRRAAAVIAVCRSLSEKARSVGSRTQVFLLEDIPNVEPFTPEMQPALRALRESVGLGDGPVVVYTGTFEAYQGIDLLMKAAQLVLREHPTVRFVLVGGEMGQVTQVKDETEKLGISRSVVVLGTRPMEEMPIFMAMADVLVSPRSLGTNTPMKIYSYLDSGRPVVATRLLTHTQVLNDDVAVLVDPVPSAMSEGIGRLLSSRELREEIGERGRNYVRTNFSFERFKEKLQAAYAVLEKK